MNKEPTTIKSNTFNQGLPTEEIKDQNNKFEGDKSDSDGDFGDMNDRDTVFQNEFENLDKRNPFSKVSPSKTISPESILD